MSKWITAAAFKVPLLSSAYFGGNPQNWKQYQPLLELRSALGQQWWQAAVLLHLLRSQTFPRGHRQPLEHPAQAHLRPLGLDQQPVRCLHNRGGASDFPKVFQKRF